MTVMRVSRWALLLMAFCTSAVVIVDQITKKMIVSSLDRLDVVPIIPNFFNLTLTYNRGVAFGLLSDLPPGTRELFLASATLLAVAVVIYLLLAEYHSDLLGQLAIALILGGAIGNSLDRFILGEVIDFLEIYVEPYYWPAFNVADSAICVGVVILLFRSPSRRSGQEIEVVEANGEVAE